VAENIAKQMTEAGNKSDHDAISKLYTEDCILISPFHEPYKGRAGIMEHCKGKPPGMEGKNYFQKNLLMLQ